METLNQHRVDMGVEHDGLALLEVFITACFIEKNPHQL